MKPRRLNLWARSVHVHCKTHRVSITVEQAVVACGEPPGGRSARKLMERAKTKGFFKSKKVRCPDGSRGRWFVAVYTAVGPTPEPLQRKKKRETPSYFNGITRATSIFELAQQCNSETTK
ncbi:MAG: hypothetical protein EKK53_26730 [Burkholderiales bacterium]|nr:MAG: hypothetical protein EKK53_26730 [Burkholderiales bacterium]